MKNETKFETRLVGIIKNYEKRVMCRFKANPLVYARLGMKKSRFNKLATGQSVTELTVEERERINRFFDCKVESLIE